MMEYYLPILNVLYGVFQHPMITHNPVVMIGNKDNVGTYGQWKTINLWDNPRMWVEENLDVCLAILAVWIMIHAEIGGFFGWSGYALYYAIINNGTIPSILGE